MARGFLQDQRGASAAEFALVLPLLTLILFSILIFGIALRDQIALTDGVRIAARELSVSRGDATPFDNTLGRFDVSIVGLKKSDVILKLEIDGEECENNDDCADALSDAVGLPVTARASYPCNLIVLSTDFASNCILSAATTARIE